MVGDEDPAGLKRWRELLASERDAAVLYSRIAQAETGERRAIFEGIWGSATRLTIRATHAPPDLVS